MHQTGLVVNKCMIRSVLYRFFIESLVNFYVLLYTALVSYVSFAIDAFLSTIECTMAKVFDFLSFVLSLDCFLLLLLFIFCRLLFSFSIFHLMRYRDMCNVRLCSCLLNYKYC